MAKLARRRHGCLERWVGNPAAYGLASLTRQFETCEKKVIKMLMELLQKRLEYSAMKHDGEEFHSAEQNARLVVMPRGTIERCTTGMTSAGI